MLSGDLGYVNSAAILDNIKDEIHEVEKMPNALIESLGNKELQV
jgi:hypothetical protein